jgi:hypothetical protein
MSRIVNLSRFAAASETPVEQESAGEILSEAKDFYLNTLWSPPNMLLGFGWRSVPFFRLGKLRRIENPCPTIGLRGIRTKT